MNYGVLVEIEIDSEVTCCC